MPEGISPQREEESESTLGICNTLESRFQVMESAVEDRAFTLLVGSGELHDVLSSLKEMKFDHFSDVACVDYIKDGSFELVYHLWSHTRKLRAAVRVRIPREAPSIRSVADLWAGAQIHERENHEMFGVDFQGNPDLSELFLEDWKEIPPFRKDFDTREYVKQKYYGGKYEFGE